MTKIDHTTTFVAPVSPIVEFWKDVLAPKFLTYRHILEGGLSRHSAQVFPRLEIQNGARVLDVGCGFGDTTLALARMVGPKGHVSGIDCCPDFVDVAQTELQSSEIGNAEFHVADAENNLPERQYDNVFARFGTMFFVNPVSGLRTMRKALRPGGRLTHIVWRQRAENPWLAAARSVLLKHLPQPDADAPSCGPGPFSMADPAVVRTQMEAAGFTDISFEKIDAKVLVGRTIDEAIAFQLALGPAGEIFRTAGDVGERKRSAIETDLQALFSSEHHDADGIWMNSASWMISATSPQQSKDIEWRMFPTKLQMQGRSLNPMRAGAPAVMCAITCTPNL
ncbi:class I SAM-dependent methyltransferase [Aliiroseovarius sp. PrR006]|uniref:class I SAM-dependent methyltransferase n=1 Tax=Aliiroseovarius sp. PrR006 TaxID=2706883 RepID=UPI0013D56198|nr:class I SAM-dependent methyltransferase [Aliiroseovarius sp. PrR006]NDW53835.1 class I SAM-dependent methyltransferase [Aliiroseovarius sp. PrR006]